MTLEGGPCETSGLAVVIWHPRRGNGCGQTDRHKQGGGGFHSNLRPDGRKNSKRSKLWHCIFKGLDARKFKRKFSEGALLWGAENLQLLGKRNQGTIKYKAFIMVVG